MNESQNSAARQGSKRFVTVKLLKRTKTALIVEDPLKILRTGVFKSWRQPKTQNFLTPHRATLNRSMNDDDDNLNNI